jgi:2-succinyl-6-hydroxy-2,4-cyclohexadiene-1-carboxylate synthase
MMRSLRLRTIWWQCSRLVLESANPGIADADAREHRIGIDLRLAERLRSEPYAQFLDDWYGMLLFGDLKAAPAYAALHARRLANDPVALAAAIDAWSPGRQPDYWPLLASGERMVHAVAGADDRKYARIASRIATAAGTVPCVVPGAAHTVHAEQPAAFAAHIRGLLC